MTFIKVNGIHKSFGDKHILKDISFEIKDYDRIGLVGYNGSGKTTLANLLFGKLLPDKGTIKTPKGKIKIGYLQQSTEYSINDFYYMQTGFPDEDVLKFTSQLGLLKVQEWDHTKLKHLSGGEKLKLALSNVWSSQPDMLILDEPTNHLDFKGLMWLVEQLKSFRGPVLIISHDRSFLDKTVNKIYEIEAGQLFAYEGGYAEYREEKERRRESQQHQYNVQQKYKKIIESQMENLRTWSDKAHRESTKGENRNNGFKEYHRMKAKKMDIQVKSKMKRLEKELDKNKIEKPKEDIKVSFTFDSIGKRGRRIIEAKNVSKSFGSFNIFKDSHFYIKHGERVGILGGNGAGKTTLIKILLGEDNITEGEIWKSDSLHIAYLSQDVHDLETDKTALEALGITNRTDMFRARTILANLGLGEEKVLQKIESLSLGERIRVKLTDMLLREYDVLILDEPTNHLDLPSREELERTLSEFSGTLIFVSHDEYFLDQLSDKLLIIEDKIIRRYEFGNQEYKNKTSIPKPNDQYKLIEEELLLIDNKITVLLGEMSMITPNDLMYPNLDKEFQDLVSKKRELLAKRN